MTEYTREQHAETAYCEIPEHWPRDDDGHYIGLDSLVLVDETGDLGRDSTRRHFIMSAMVTREPEEFDDIAMRYPRDTRDLKSGPTGELKFVSSCRDVRIEVLYDIAATRPRIYMIDTDKGSEKNTTWPRSGDALYVRSTKALMRMVARNNRGVVGVIFDQHTALKEEEALKICSEVSTSKVRICCLDATADSKVQTLLQTNDFVPGSMGYEINVRREGLRGPEDYDYLSIIKPFVKKAER